MSYLSNILLGLESTPVVLPFFLMMMMVEVSSTILKARR